MRIAIMGQAAFGAKVLETLSDRGEEIVAAWLPQGKAGGKIDPMQSAADSRGIAVFQPESYKAPETLEAFRVSRPDLLIMAFVTDIIPLPLIKIPTQGAICYHPSLLPRHRGGSAINWTLIMGDRETGLSIFWTDAGIDTGPILLQKRIPIEPEDTAGALYFNRLEQIRVRGLQPHPGLRPPARGIRLLSGEKDPFSRCKACRHSPLKMRMEINRFRIDLNGERNPDPPQYFKAVEMVLRLAGRNLDSRKIERAIALSREKYCSVYNSLRPDMDLKVVHVIEDSDPK